MGRVLVACEWSGMVREAFLALGHDAYSCDLSRCVWHQNMRRHYRQDVRPLLREPWDLVIAHPPCTYICRSGSHWLGRRPGRWKLMEQACEFFNLCLAAGSPRVCVENPVPHGHAAKMLDAPYTQIVHPWWFGHPVSKATCLWLRGLPALRKTSPVAVEQGSLATMEFNVRSACRSRSDLRSVTFQGIADAMASQWGGLL